MTADSVSVEKHPREDSKQLSETKGKLQSAEKSVLPAQTIFKKVLETDDQSVWSKLAEIWPKLPPESRAEMVALASRLAGREASQ